MFEAINAMMLDVLAAISRKDYPQGASVAPKAIKKAQAAGKYKGRIEDTERNLQIQKQLKSGISSWNENQAMFGCSRGTVAKQAAILKAET